MSSCEEFPLPTLPPTICTNVREKIAPEQIDPNRLILPRNSKIVIEPVLLPVPEAPEPCPRYPLTIALCPDQLYFELDTESIIHKLWIGNSCTRMIYIHCCGLWNDTARLGASWRTYPRTRFHLAPGLKSELFVKATPRPNSPVPQALIDLQLAASHMRDNITGYFVVPILAKFLKYKPPNVLGEEG